MTSRFSYCEDIVKTSDEDRYLGALFAPRDKRDALCALYAFNIEVGKIRESVSEPMLGHIRLQWWREAIEGIYEGAPRKHDVVLALAEVVDTYSLPRDLFDHYLDAREKDLEQDPFEAVDDLYAYCDGTAGHVLRLAAYILLSAEEASAIGSKLNDPAKAWALLGLVRAMPFALQKGWLFLPKDLRTEFGVSYQKAYDGRWHEGLSIALGDIMTRAWVAHEASQSIVRVVPQALFPALLPNKLFPKYRVKLLHQDFNPFQTSVDINIMSKQVSMMWMMLSGRL